MTVESSYDLLSPETVAAYLASRPPLRRLLDTSAPLEVREVGDGNLNLIFIVHDHAGASLALKQALPYVRMVGPSWPLTPERTTAEARAVQVYNRIAPEYGPKFYDFDHERHVLAMEDLSTFQVWRTALNNGERHEGVAAAMGRYVARGAFFTSVFGVEAKELKGRVAEAINPWLCEITEDLVFTEPYVEEPRNWFQVGLKADVESLRDDRRFVSAMGELKYAFMTKAEALLHGDLHTGSVMVRVDGEARAFDDEFSFYGPVGFDLSCLFGNYLFAYERATLLGNRAQRAWVRGLADETWEAFVFEMRRLWPSRVDPGVFTDEFLESWLADVLADAIGMTAAELCRRTIGLAHVSDIETLDAPVREQAVRALLQIARRIAPERHGIDSPEVLMSVVDDMLGTAR